MSPLIYGGLGGGSLVATTSVTAGTPAFFASHVFDLGAPAAAQITFSVLALAPDGETFGNTPGTIQVITENAMSLDGVTFSALGTSLPPYPLGAELFAVGAHETAAGVVTRYLECYVAIVSTDSFLVYSGPNQPSALVQIAATYK